MHSVFQAEHERELKTAPGCPAGTRNRRRNRHFRIQRSPVVVLAISTEHVSNE